MEIGGFNPMHRATELNLLNIMDLFAQCGGDFTAENGNGWTCLHIAAKHGLEDMVKFLLTKGKLHLQQYLS